jgi:hypothetical protein
MSLGLFTSRNGTRNLILKKNRNGCNRTTSKKGNGKLIWQKWLGNGFYNILRLEVGILLKMCVNSSLNKLGVSLESVGLLSRDIKGGRA